MDTDAELVGDIAKNSTCGYSAILSLVNELATILVRVLVSWTAIGVEDCPRAVQTHACKVVFIVL